jgi:serine/threonine protein kinase
MNWICNGEPKNTRFLHITSFPHEPIANTGKYCTKCGLSKEAMNSEDQPSLTNAPSVERLLGGRYRIIDFLAKGGFGETYRAEDIKNSNNPCFIKQLKPAQSEASEDLQTAKRLFDKEAETLNRLGDHAQIPKLLAYFEEKNEFYLVQELIEGNAINQELTPGKFWEQEQAVHLITEVLEVLSFVHSQGVIHRDIKPHNLIRRRKDNKLVLVDFGAVKEVRMINSIFAAPVHTVAIGTQGYTPPEQLQGRPQFSSDIYSLGLVGIQALTGIAPHKLDINQQDGEFLWKQNIQINEHLAFILSKMTRFNPSERYQSAAEVLKSIRQLSFFESAQIIDPPTLISPPPPSISSQQRSFSQVNQVNVTSLGQNSVANNFFATGTIRQSNFFANQSIRYQKIDETLKFYVGHLDREYKTLSKQADTTYKLWVFCVILGILILVSGIVMTFIGMLTQAIMTAASTVIIYFIQRIFQQREDYYREQISIKNKHLEYGNQWLLAIQTIDAINDPVEREKRQARLVEVLTSKLGLSKNSETQT